MIARARLATFVAGVILLWLALDRAAISLAWVTLPLAGFVALVLVHLRVGEEGERARRGVAFYERRLANLEDRWAGSGDPGERYRDPRHPYADDLDVFGEGSLFERLASTRTAVGARTLAGWLVAPADPAIVAARHQAIGELAPDLALREALAVLGPEVGAGDPALLEAWGAAVPPGPASWSGVAAVACSTATGLALAAALWLDTGTTPFLIALAAQVALEASQRTRVARTLAGLERSARELELLSTLLAVLERAAGGWSAPRLAELAGELGRETPGASAAGRIRRLRRLVDLLDSGRNVFFAPLALWLSWRLHVARALAAWRRHDGPQIARWLTALGELEALLALASYAAERPDDRFPEIVPGEPVFQAEGIGHPLLPQASCVRNDVRLGDLQRALVVSGSNMSGKSTLLRAVGVNAVLALAGAPVHAHRLLLSPLRVGASIRVRDSLLEGSSRFHAELGRLKQLMDLAGEGPLLFLLDEVLHGTNSHDRRLGAEAIVRGLVRRGAIGLVTTHDLALAELAADGSGVANVHFVDHLEDGRMRFDYRMHPGVVRRSNALELMRAVGIEV